MTEEKTSLNDIWNNHWNNYIHFCRIMEPYINLYYSIKHGNIGLLKYAMREIYIIL